MRLILSTLLVLSAAAPALASHPGTLACTYTTKAGGRATVSVTLDKDGTSANAVVVRGGDADFTLRRTGPSGKGLEVTRWRMSGRATEIDFIASQETGGVRGHVSFEPQGEVFRFELKGATPALREALRLEGGWFVVAMKPGAAECQVATVGVATMQPDGTLHMQYRSYDHGMVAEALQVVTPDAPEYKGLLEHLGGLKPGESRPIPEFPPTGEVR